jgi:hypothetical protein
MWRWAWCGIAAVAFTLCGCAEIDRRGGLTDQVSDAILFRADTKTHRLLRAYTLIGTLMAVARRHGQDATSQAIIVPHLTAALKDAYEAYLCVFPLPPSQNDNPNLWRCQFFDEKMSRLDYSLYRLAMVTLFEKEDRKFFAEVRDRLVGKIPIATDGIKALLHASAATKQTFTVAEELLQLSFTGLETVAYLLPIYRDILELDMWVIIDNLTPFCPAEGPRPMLAFPGPAAANGVKVAVAPIVVIPAYSTADPCPTLRYAISIFNNGNGNLRLWREFIRMLNGEVQNIEAQQIHFRIVGRWLWFSCLEVLKGDKADPAKKCADIAAEVDNSIKDNLYFMIPTPGPKYRGVDHFYSTSIMPPSMMTRARQIRTPPAKASKDVRERTLGVPAQPKGASGTTGTRSAPDRPQTPE